MTGIAIAHGIVVGINSVCVTVIGVELGIGICITICIVIAIEGVGCYWNWG